MQGMVPLSGFGGVPYSAVRKAAPRNILDNSDFTNLVAQAGIGGNHGSIAYAADRWILDSGKVSYKAGVGLTLNGTIRQKLEFPPTGETSAFVGMASGAASISYADGAVTITSSGGVLKWAALYGGVYSAAAMPDYQPKGYGAELAECQRYYIKMDRVFTAGWVSGSARTYYIPVSIPVGMRLLPTVTMDGYIGRIYNGYSNHTGPQVTAPESLKAYVSSPFESGLIVLQDTVDTAVDVNNSIVAFQLNNTILSADL